MTLIVQFMYVLMAMKSQTAISVFTTVVFVASNRTIEIWIVFFEERMEKNSEEDMQNGE